MCPKLVDFPIGFLLASEGECTSVWLLCSVERPVDGIPTVHAKKTSTI